MESLYLAVEGIVGSGTTTLSAKLYVYLKDLFPQRQVILTNEPGGSEVADAIRKVVQGTKFTEPMDPICEAYLYAASRAQTLRKVVLPVLETGGIVISTRSLVSSFAFQGHGRDLSIETIIKINQTAVGKILPNLVIQLDVEPEIGLARANDPDGDKFEAERIEFFKAVRLGYLETAQMNIFQGKWITIPVNGDADQVFAQALECLQSFERK